MAATSIRLRAAALAPTSAAEVPALEQEVRAGHHPAVRGGQDRGVVADPDQGARIGREPL
jgi:hypothetical protein